MRRPWLVDNYLNVSVTVTFIVLELVPHPSLYFFLYPCVSGYKKRRFPNNGQQFLDRRNSKPTATNMKYVVRYYKCSNHAGYEQK